MGFEKTLVEKWVETLVEKAEGCFDLAEIQHKTADQQLELAEKHRQLSDKQHETADKIDEVGRTLIANAVALQGELELEAVRSGPQLHGVAPKLKVMPPAIPK